MTVDPCSRAVEPLRSCYRTLMHFPGIGDVMVRWYWTTSPFLDKPNVYNSRNWLTDHDAEYPAGEVKGAPRKWVNGSPPGNLCCSGPQGSAAAWTGAEPPPTFPVCGFPDQHYPEWDQERSWSAIKQTTGAYLLTWSKERAWSADVATKAAYSSTWSKERAWSADVATKAAYSSTWSKKRGWWGIMETVGRYAPYWSHESLWSAVEKATAVQSATWSHESLWSTLVTPITPKSATWSHESEWDVIMGTVDNVTSFQCGTVVAAGSTQGTATTIAADTNLATSTGANQGVILPAGCYRVIVKNNNSGGGNAINVYPPSGASISALATNAAVTVPAGTTIMFCEVSSTKWHTIALS